MMASKSLAPLAQDLSSLDHALLLSLIAGQHCLIQTDPKALDDVVEEVQLVNFLIQCRLEIADGISRLLHNSLAYLVPFWSAIRNLRLRTLVVGF